MRFKGTRTLTGRQLAALRELYLWREELAARQDRATFRIIGNDALLAVSRSLPRTVAALEQTAGVPPVLAARHGAELIESVRRALALDEAALPSIARTARMPKDPAFDARVERLKVVRNRVAAELGLDPGVLCGRNTLEAVARAHPNDRAGLTQVGELRRWQISVLGDALLAALA
jgi:ribonuclease D